MRAQATARDGGSMQGAWLAVHVVGALIKWLEGRLPTI